MIYVLDRTIYIFNQIAKQQSENAMNENENELVKVVEEVKPPLKVAPTKPVATILVDDTPLGRKVGRILSVFLSEALSFEDAQRRNPKREYPKTVAECIDENMKYRPGVLTAVKKFRKSGPWEGTEKEMQDKILVLNEELAKLYEIATPKVVFVDEFPAGPCCIPGAKPAVIFLQQIKSTGKYSIVAFLHEFGHTLGKGEKETCRWSLNLFKRVFPKQYEKLKPGEGEHDGHILYRPKDEETKDEVSSS
jgi:hypothetical protein